MLWPASQLQRSAGKPESVSDLTGCSQRCVAVVWSHAHLVPGRCLPWEAVRLTVVIEVSQNSNFHEKLEFFNLCCIFPLPLSPLRPSLAHSNHTYLCPCVKILGFIINNKYCQFTLQWQAYFVHL